MGRGNDGVGAVRDTITNIDSQLDAARGQEAAAQQERVDDANAELTHAAARLDNLEAQAATFRREHGGAMPIGNPNVAALRAQLEGARRAFERGDLAGATESARGVQGGVDAAAASMSQHAGAAARLDAASARVAELEKNEDADSGAIAAPAPAIPPARAPARPTIDASSILARSSSCVLCPRACASELPVTTPAVRNVHVDVPATWADFSVVTLAGSEGGGFRANVVVTSDALAAGGDAATHAKQQLRAMKQDEGPWEGAARGAATVAGTPGYVVELGFESDGQSCGRCSTTRRTATA